MIYHLDVLNVLCKPNNNNSKFVQLLYIQTTKASMYHVSKNTISYNIPIIL
jgi:hypothetical protein